MKTIKEIQDEVAKEQFPALKYEKWEDIDWRNRHEYWPEVCNRYAFEVARASLGKAAVNKKWDLITSESNIVIPNPYNP